MPSGPEGRDRRQRCFTARRRPRSRPRWPGKPEAHHPPLSPGKGTADLGRTDSMKRTTKKARNGAAREPDLVPEAVAALAGPAAPAEEKPERPAGWEEDLAGAESLALDEDEDEE